MSVGKCENQKKVGPKANIHFLNFLWVLSVFCQKQNYNKSPHLQLRKPCRLFIFPKSVTVLPLDTRCIVFPFWLHLPWRWRQQDPPKFQYISVSLHDGSFRTPGNVRI